MTSIEELLELAQILDETAKNFNAGRYATPIGALEKSAEEVGRSFSGSWLGYHSRVYYAQLRPVPPGARFSQEWGLEEMFTDMGSKGDWHEVDAESLKVEILRLAGDPDLNAFQKETKIAHECFLSSKAAIISILTTEIDESADEVLLTLKDDLNKLEILSKDDAINSMSPKGRAMSRDAIAVGQGYLVPPHVEVLAEVYAIRQAYRNCESTARISTTAASHLERKSRRFKVSNEVGTKFFIGHGQTTEWRELKDFLQDRLSLPWDEFNRLPVAGVTNISRLSEMINEAAIAFLVMTAEDEMADGAIQARMNVIHEVGLLQGKLGFSKAIVLLEMGCEEFSNIHGLGQIRFPKGNISACFEDIRQVLERERLI